MPTLTTMQNLLPSHRPFRFEIAAALAVLGAALPCASQTDTLFVAGREDHSPALCVNPAGRPALTWIATVPDPTGSLGYDELFYSEQDPTGRGTPSLLAGPGNYFTPRTTFSTAGVRWTCAARFENGDSQILCIRQT